MYMQAESPLYDVERMQIPMHSGDIEVTYVEMVNESCVEFAHTHVDYEIYFCMEGQLRIHMENEEHLLRANQFALLAPGTVHNVIYEPKKPKKYLAFVFQYPKLKRESAGSEQYFLEAFGNLFSSKNYYISDDRYNSQDLFEKMTDELTHKLYGYKELLRGYYLEFIIRILRNLITERPWPEESNPNVNMAIKITKYMHQNYNRNIGLQDVADAMYVTPRHINRIFQEFFGSSFHKTLRTYRVNYAKNYLYDTDFSLEKIAEMIGFSSPQPLLKLFFEMEGMTMTEYRQAHQRQSAKEAQGQKSEEGTPGNGTE